MKDETDWSHLEGRGPLSDMEILQVRIDIEEKRMERIWKRRVRIFLGGLALTVSTLWNFGDAIWSAIKSIKS